LTLENKYRKKQQGVGSCFAPLRGCPGIAVLQGMATTYEDLLLTAYGDSFKVPDQTVSLYN